MAGSPTNARDSGNVLSARYKVRFWNQSGEATGFTTTVSPIEVVVETNRLFSIGARLHLEFNLRNRMFMAEGVVTHALRTPASLRSIKPSRMRIAWTRLSDRLRLEEREPKPPKQEPAPATEPGTAGTAAVPQEQEVDNANLTVDLQDPMRLLTVLEQELKQGCIFLRSETPPPVNQDVTVGLLLPDGHDPIETHGRVLQHSADPKGASVVLHDTGRVLELVARVVVTLPMDAHDPSVMPKLTLDLSDELTFIAVLGSEIRMGGVFVNSPEPLELGTQVWLEIIPPPPGSPIEAKGRVIEIEDDTLMAYVEFESLDDTIKALEAVSGGGR